MRSTSQKAHVELLLRAVVKSDWNSLADYSIKIRERNNEVTFLFAGTTVRSSGFWSCVFTFKSLIYVCFGVFCRILGRGDSIERLIYATNKSSKNSNDLRTLLMTAEYLPYYLFVYGIDDDTVSFWETEKAHVKLINYRTNVDIIKLQLYLMKLSQCAYTTNSHWVLHILCFIRQSSVIRTVGIYHPFPNPASLRLFFSFCSNHGRICAFQHSPAMIPIVHKQNYPQEAARGKLIDVHKFTFIIIESYRQIIHASSRLKAALVES